MLTHIKTYVSTFQGLVKLTLLALRETIRYVKINAKQCRIYRVLLNDELEVPFQYFDPLLEIYQENEHEYVD